MRLFLFSILICSLLITFNSCETSPKNTDKETTTSMIIPTLEQKIGQMLLIGFRDTVLTDQSHIKRDILKHHIGGILIYDYDVPTKSRPRNITDKAQIKKLITDLQSLKEEKLFISIDEEGGKVARLKTRYGFPPTVSAQHLGELDNADSTRYWTSQIVNRIADLGINMNFAPVVDVNVNPDCPVIGGIGRSFSADPNMVTKHAAIVIEEHKKRKVLCSLKHFPGHGSAKMDSHLDFTDVSDTWTPLELLPYASLIQQGKCDMIMTAHVFNRNLDSLYPATMSKAIMQDKLRGELKWDGIIISDDMHMLAIADNYGLEMALEKTINAGVDIIILSNNSPKPYDSEVVPKAVKIITKLVKDGVVKESRIEEAYGRIMKLKGTL